MDYTIESHPDYILAATAGTASVAELEEALAAIFRHPDWRPGFCYIFDHGRLHAEHLTVGDIRTIAASARALRSKHAVRRSAIVAPSDVEFGLSRMWLALVSDDERIATNVFRSRDEAVAWVSS